MTNLERRRPIDAAVDAMLTEMGRRARSRLVAFGPDSDSLVSNLRDLITSSDFQYFVSIVSILDDILLSFIQSRLYFENAQERTRYTGPLGPFGTFYGRMGLLKCLKWVSNDTFTVIDDARNIRNKLSHKYGRDIFQDQKIKSLIASMATKNEKRVRITLEAAVGAADKGQSISIQLSDMNIAKMAILLTMSGLIRELYVLSSDHIAVVPPAYIAGPYDELVPEEMRLQMRAPIRIALEWAFGEISERAS